MKALMSSSILRPWQWQPPHQKPPTPLVCCSAVNASSSSSSSSSEMKFKGDGNAESVSRAEDIWKLFREAQKNILQLNQQRVKAVEELNKITREKELLVDRIEQLELEKQAAIARPQDRVSCWELLFRIDSMVLNGMVTTVEASDLRRLVMDNKFSLPEVFNDTLQKGDTEILAELRHFSKSIKRNCFHIVHVCTEMAPLVSFGSLASYVTGLSCALQRKGNLVEVILPNIVYGIGVTLIQPVYYSSFFNRERLYGYSDDFERFTYFSRASLDYIVKSGKRPDVIHIHNWETAIVGPLFWDITVKQGLEGTRILLTCHDLNSQCLEHPEKLELCGLDPARLHRPDRLQDNTKAHLVNILKGGVVYSNKVVIMSSILSKGRVIQSLSHGLDPTLNIHKNKVIIAPCGFDNSTWDPSTDNFLPVQYNAKDMKGKTVCKAALQQHLGLSEHASTFLVGCVFSKVSDVDLEKLREIFSKTSRIDVQFIVMGIGKISSVNKLGSLHEPLKEANVQFIDGNDEALSHLVFAGSDIILCQSFHDPDLQVPLKALKYGAAPITVNSNDEGFGNFVEHNYETTNFSRFISSTFGNMTLSQALDEIKNNPSKWKRKITDAMEMDFSWDAECCDIHTSAYTALKNL
ncbi:probable starch synthase 4, chloroplastic/amyloplastic isoform X2 [Pyrus x bretschneideri]|uniref:probable starch synthase 4, chloroplastic/amyloplastic isoform X2 n=1 Tax=Pyrus x bretschneideri TaxID=225117 RepID=UPI002030C2BA|nr:probable starch synthase 4, chloroplastic/amyloplastic isoform X2 [Pyrus x bretschneideri]